MRGKLRKQYGSKLFALFIVIIMVTVVYPVIVDNAKSPSQLSVYDDGWNDMSQFATDLNVEENGKHNIKTIVSRPSIINKIAEVEKNTTEQTILNNQTILVIIGVERMYNEYDSEALHAFVSSGGKVVIADDSSYGNTAFHGQAGALEIDVKLRTNRVQTGCVPEDSSTLVGSVLETMGYEGGGSSDPKCKPAQLYDMNHWEESIHTQNVSTVIIDANIERMDFNGQIMMSAPGALTIKPGGKAEGLAWSSQEAYIDYDQNGLGGVGEGTYRENSTNGVEVVSEANIGEGKVIFISDTSLFTNRYYDELDNKEFINKLFEYLSEGKKQTIIFDESRHIQSDLISLVYIQLFGILGHISSSEVLGMILLGSIILLMQIVMMRVENPSVWRHSFNIYEGRLSRFRVPHAHYTHPESIKEIFIDKVRIENGFTREEFGMLASSKIEEIIKDPILIRFIINNEKNMTLKQVEEAIKGWEK